jgi:hypothetical protein
MIRFTFKFLKPVAIFLAIAVLFQCCKVYHKDPISVDVAVSNEVKRVKVITNDDRVYVFDSIYYKQDKLYGLSAKKDKSELLIIEESIKEIHLYNPGKSTGMTVLLILSIPAAFAVIVIIAWVNSPYYN